MAHTIYCGKIAKKVNSTYVPTAAELTKSFDVLLKTPTSLHTPTFTISAETFPYNYIQWDDRYYFVTDVTARNNALWDVSAVCDVLATYRDDILNSTQYVSYSSSNTSIWLPDTRIPVKKNATVSRNTASLSIFDTDGFYVLSVIGENGSEIWACTISDIRAILGKITVWSDELIDAIMQGIYPISGIGQAPGGSVTYDWSTPEAATESLAMMNTLTGFAGNAYAAAPDCLRSCIWVPFKEAEFSGTGGTIYLGQFNTQVQTDTCRATPVTGSSSVNIPWQHSDWRRAVCEEVYLYLPLVGMVSLPSDELVNETSITVKYSATATDGCIAYEIMAGSQTIGTYGANCSANYAIGISQQASAGEIVQTAFAGAEKVVSTAVQAATSINPAGWIAGGAAAAFDAVSLGYNTLNTSLTRHNSCIGGIGGGAGSGLSLDIACFTVSHDTVIAPADMQATMGLPTMAPMQLGSLTGFCQCANAHVAAEGAEFSELAQIDAYLNSGFFIEDPEPEDPEP